MASLIESIGDAVDSPESAWEAMASHKATRLASIALGLGAFSRLVTIILDIHRLSIGGSLDARTMEIVLGTLARGSIWHSIIIAACGLAVILAGCSITAVAISKAGNNKKYTPILIELIAATTIRLPIIAGTTLIALFFTGAVYVTELPLSLGIWIAGFAIALLETWRVSWKVAVRHEARPRTGILVALLSSVIMTAIAIGIIYLIGGID
jgi:hypothetical protein